MNFKLNLLIMLMATQIICQQNLVNAQSFGFEIGAAGVENFDAGELNLGFSLNLPLSDNVFCDLSYNFWQGEDGNYTKDYNDLNSWSDGLYYGSTGLNLTLFYQIYQTNNFSALVGSGLGRYQMIELTQLNEKNFFYQSTYSLSTLLKYQLSELFGFYGKALINTDSLNEIPNWGLFNIGIEFSPF